MDAVKVFKWNIAMSQSRFLDAQSSYVWVNELWISDYNQAVLDYNTANTFYGIKNFSGALKYYSKVKDIDKDLSYFKYHNLWNSLYRFWQTQNDETKVLAWEKALHSYEIALKSDTEADKKETLSNYEFVKDELEKLKNKMEEKKKEQKKVEENKKDEQKPKDKDKPDTKKEDSNNTKKTDPENKDKPSDNAQNKWDSTAQPQKGDQSQKSWVTDWNFNQLGQNWAENKIELSPDEKKELDDYSKYLKQFQKDNLWQVKKGRQITPQDLFNSMMWNTLADPLFNDKAPVIDKDW